MADDVHQGVCIGFLTSAFPEDEVELHGVEGREELSHLFEFELLLVRRSGPWSPDDLDEVMKKPCAIGMGQRPGDVVHGMLRSIELVQETAQATATYRATMVPTVWLLTLARRSAIYQDTTVPDMVKGILESYGMKTGVDFEIRVRRAAKSPKREYLVQYEESDWDFIQRWLEHEGMYYWFVHHKTGETLVIADENGDTTAIEDPSVIPYRDKNNLAAADGAASIWDWRLSQRHIPAQVALMDYNYREAAKLLVVMDDVDTKRGFGSAIYYGDHFKDVDGGKALAKLRSERFRAERRTFHGLTDCARFRVGHSFEIENHHDASVDGAYLITSVEHQVGRPVEIEAPGDIRAYFARFTAIPLGVEFRPERRTPWPSINGFLHAHVDGDTTGSFAEVDGEGRYKVRFPFDNSTRRGQTSSRWVRFAQPYAGPGYGIHHPLHKGIEVMIVHLNGDPDRPIIAGAIPNPHTRSPVTDTNATQSVTQTASELRIEIEDNQN